MSPCVLGESPAASPRELRPSRLALVLLLALPVFLVNPWAKDVFVAPKEAMVQLLIVFVVAVGVLSHKGQLRIPVSSLSAPLVGLILLASLSASRSVDPLWSFLEVPHLVLLVILFHLLLGRKDGGERVTFLFRTMAIVGGAASLYGLLQLLGLEIVGTNVRFFPISVLGNTAFAAEYILLVLPPALALTLSAASRRALIFWGAVSLVLVLHLAATQTRAAFLGLTLGVAAAAAFWWCSAMAPGNLPPSRRRFILVGSILAMAYVLFLFPQPFKATRPIAARVLQSEGWQAERAKATVISPGKSLFNPRNLKQRLTVSRAGLQLIRDHPWTGVGLTNLEVVFPPKYQPFEYWWPEGWVIIFLHNELLQVAAELGLPALALVLWMVILLVATLRRSCQASLPSRDRLLITASLCALIAISVDSLFSFPWHLPVQRLYAVIHGACLIALAGQGPVREIRIARVSALVAAGALLAMVALGPVRREIAETYAMSGWRALDRGAYAEAVAAYHAADSWFPQLFPRSQLVMQAQDPRPHYEKAVHQLRGALRRDPRDEVALTNLALALQGAGRVEEAGEVLQRLLERRPGDKEILRRLVDLALVSGRPGEALRHFEALTAGAPCDGELLYRIALAYHRSGEWETSRTIWERAAACGRRSGLPEAWLKRPPGGDHPLAAPRQQTTSESSAGPVR
jgi:O-antigen ligase/Flp pilus assembly protein TadD